MTTLFRPRLMAAFVACVALAAPAQAQFDPFHRQAPPADIPGGAAGDPGQAAELVLRVNQLEEELRQANGRIEELENAEHRLETELQKFRQDVEYRFGDRSEGAPPAPDVAEAPQSPGEPAAPARPRKSSDAFDPDADPNAPGAPRPLGTTPPSTPLVREAPGAAAGQPLELGKAPAPESSKGPPPPSGPTIVGSGVAMLDQPREQFNAALQAFQAGQYPEAEAGFKAFLAANPSHRMSADAIFYIGETYLQRSRPREAAEQYLKVTTDYSKSSRAPESMVRLGQTLAALGNNEQACATLTEFGKRYPAASASVKKLAEHESAKDHC
ncbi:MAG: tol-pal system protein YbgF [Roseiarcus sp.]|uniref:tol-pal system protein YbgF n=1 Tax=Roseiarcus sp. TaxID=1969460 RepID=UPI003C5AC1E7